MARDPQKSTDGFTPRLCLFFAALGATIGAQLPFFPVWLAAKGLDARLIGIVLAMPLVMRIVCVPLIAREADRRNSVAGAIIATSAVSAAGVIVLAFVEGAFAIFVTYALISIAFTAIMPLADAYALIGLARRGRAYGPVRLWASAGFIATNLGIGLLLSVIAPEHLIWPLAAVTVMTAAAAFTLAPAAPHSPDTTPHPPASIVWRNTALLAVIAAASLVQASHAVYYGFSALDWRAAGFSGTTIGALWALGVAAEIVLFAYSGRLPPAFGPLVLLALGAAGATLRWAVMAFDPPATLLPALQALHALSYGATHLGAVGYLARAVPERLGATAQGYLATALGIAMAAATALSGELYAAFGDFAYAPMALLAAVGLAFALVARKVG
ncbi:MAG: MFS transporter [Rhizobiales bacterium]|nr:MFS transporter [Hyphomicrobiales bacterium]